MTLKVLGGRLKGRTLFALKGAGTRPTLSRCREAIFNICSLEIEGANFLDLFAGSGAMSIEAISRGAKYALCVEKNKAAVHIIKKNIALCELEESIDVLCLDYRKIFSKTDKKFDIVYIDPPYEFYNKNNKRFAKDLLILLIDNKMLSPGGKVFFEMPSNVNLDLDDEIISKAIISTKIKRYGSVSLQVFSF